MAYEKESIPHGFCLFNSLLIENPLSLKRYLQRSEALHTFLPFDLVQDMTFPASLVAVGFWK